MLFLHSEMATPAPIDDTDEYTALSRAIHEDGLHLRLGKRWPGVEGLLYRNRAEGKLFRVSILGPSVPAVLAAMDTNYEISREELLGDAPYIRKELANPYDFWHVEFATPADFLLAQKGVEFTTGVYTRSAMAEKYDPPRLGAFFWEMATWWRWPQIN